MPLYRFGQNDIFHNRIETHPQCNFLMHSGSVYYNNRSKIPGFFVSDVVPTGSNRGSISLYELNVDRDGTSHTFDPSSEDINSATDTKNLIFPFLYKDGTYSDFKTVTLTTVDGDNITTWNSAAYGDILVGSYPQSASILKEYFAVNHVDDAARAIGRAIDVGTGERTDGNDLDVRILPSTVGHGPQIKSSKGSKISALKNTFDRYTYLSHHYTYSSASTADPRLGAITHSPIARWNKAVDEAGLISIPSIYYGREIKKGTVNLRFYITGTLVGELKDEKHNGELVQIGPKDSEGSASVAGVVLYNEGFVLLTGSWDLSEASSPFGPVHTERYIGLTTTSPRWIDFAQSIATGSAVYVPSSSFELNFSGTNYIPTMTMMAHARKGHLNFSNNPTYIKYGQTIDPITSSIKFREQPEREIKNIVSSSHKTSDFTASYKRQTYISKIGIYDERRNLIGVAKVATPVKKTEDRDFTFKLKLDF